MRAKSRSRCARISDMDKTRELIEEIISGEEPNVAAYLSAVLRVRGEIPVKKGAPSGIFADSAFRQVVFDFINKVRRIYPEAQFETGGRGEGEARRYYFELEGKAAEELLKFTRLQMVTVGSGFDLEGDEDALVSFVRGLFAGGGTLTLPGEGERGYYMELRVPDFEETERLRTALAVRGVLLESAGRRADSLLYTRRSEEICNMLAFMRAGGCAVEVYDLVVSRNAMGTASMRANYQTSNVDKAMAKAAQQVEAIEFLRAKGELKEEDGETKLIWSAREEHRTESTAFLASLLGMSKSKVVRRLQKAIDKAKQKGM